MFTKVYFFLIPVYLLLGLSSCSQKSKKEDLKLLFSDYYKKRCELFPIEATRQGLKDYNSLLPIDISESFRDSLGKFYSEFLKRVEAVDKQSLDQFQAKDLASLEFILKSEQMQLDYPSHLMPFSQFTGLPLDMAQLGGGDGGQPFSTQKDYYDWIKRSELFNSWVDTAIHNFRKGMAQNIVLPKTLVVKMIPQMKDLAVEKNSVFYGPLNKFPKEFTSVEKDTISKKLRIAIQNKVIPAYSRLAEFLEKEYLPKARESSGVGALPKGDTFYNSCVYNWTTTSKSVDEIHEMGLKEVARIQEEMMKVKTQVGFKGDIKSFFENVKTDPKLMPFKKPEEVLKAFATIQKNIDPNLKKLFSNTPKCSFSIKRTEAYRENSASAEYMPGTPDGKRGGVFYVPIPDATKFNVTSGMESLFLHEAIPGHHYQCSLQMENSLLPDFMKFVWFGAYGEGWALYCESLGKELGIYTDPYQYFGALGDEMHRAIRLVVDTGIHAKGWSREKALQYMMDNEAISEQGATAEIERYMAYPGQALSYKIGALKIRELRTKYEKEAKKQYTTAKFHDYMLSLGCVPLEVLESSMDSWYEKL
ncbi:MAG: DUF885 domain-containing protein [Leadbetterella sp.]